jgi:hypothetical protein
MHMRLVQMKPVHGAPSEYGDHVAAYMTLSSPGSYLQMGSVAWFLTGMPISASMGTVVNGLYSSTQNSSRTGFIWTNLINVIKKAWREEILGRPTPKLENNTKPPSKIGNNYACIRETFGSDLCWETVFSQSRQMPGQYLKLGHALLFSLYFKFIIHRQPLIRRHIVWIIYRVVN